MRKKGVYYKCYLLHEISSKFKKFLSVQIHLNFHQFRLTFEKSYENRFQIYNVSNLKVRMFEMS